MKYSIKLFAYDASLFTVIRDPDQAAILLNHDLRIIEARAYKWGMSFNPDPMRQAIEVIFSRKGTTVNHPAIYFNDTQVIRTNEHKHSSLVI